MKTIAEILKKSDSPLANLTSKLKFYQDLEVIFCTALDSNLAKHCHIAGYKDTKLTITVDNISSATKLRYAIPDIIKQLRIQPEFKDLASVRHIVTTSNIPKIQPKSTCTKLSYHNEMLWRKMLDQLRKAARRTRVK